VVGERDSDGHGKGIRGGGMFWLYVKYCNMQAIRNANAKKYNGLPDPRRYFRLTWISVKYNAMRLTFGYT
jgi:uncharacterized membrane protein